MSRIALVSVTVLLSVGCQRTVSIPLPRKLNVEVTGSDFQWHVRYAGPDETMRTPDDYFASRNITLLAGTPTTISLKSDDYVYGFALPHLGLREIAVPDLSFSLDFRPEEVGEFTLKGDQLCGYQHPKLIGKVHVLAPREFSEWQNDMALAQKHRQHD